MLVCDSCKSSRWLILVKYLNNNLVLLL
jgi:hypothetical protein